MPYNCNCCPCGFITFFSCLFRDPRSFRIRPMTGFADGSLPCSQWNNQGVQGNPDLLLRGIGGAYQNCSFPGSIVYYTTRISEPPTRLAIFFRNQSCPTNDPDYLTGAKYLPRNPRCCGPGDIFDFAGWDGVAPFCSSVPGTITIDRMGDLVSGCGCCSDVPLNNRYYLNITESTCPLFKAGESLALDLENGIRPLSIDSCEQPLWIHRTNRSGINFTFTFFCVGFPNYYWSVFLACDSIIVPADNASVPTSCKPMLWPVNYSFGGFYIQFGNPACGCPPGTLIRVRVSE